jgi:hypothetical protein
MCVVDPTGTSVPNVEFGLSGWFEFEMEEIAVT